MAKKTKPIYELLLDDENFDGLQYLSLVHDPAIMVNFIKLSKKINLIKNQEKRIITGPVLIPDQLIDRGDCFIMIKESTILKINEHFFKNFKNQSININHEIPVNDNTIVESWIIDDPEYDKSTKLGFHLPKGTWMISIKIDNDEVWNKIKNEDLRGYSIEGYLTQVLIKASIFKTENHFDEESIKYLEELIKKSSFENSEIDEIINEIKYISKNIENN